MGEIEWAYRFHWQRAQADEATIASRSGLAHPSVRESIAIISLSSASCRRDRACLWPFSDSPESALQADCFHSPIIFRLGVGA